MVKVGPSWPVHRGNEMLKEDLWNNNSSTCTSFFFYDKNRKRLTPSSAGLDNVQSSIQWIHILQGLASVGICFWATLHYLMPLDFLFFSFLAPMMCFLYISFSPFLLTRLIIMLSDWLYDYKKKMDSLCLGHGSRIIHHLTANSIKKTKGIPLMSYLWRWSLSDFFYFGNH